ncbi:MAG: hypothetical protein ACRELB_19340 [Polyangiaceae bacterium]
MAALVLAATGLGAVGLAGCAVSDTDVHRWETTESGPEKLYAIVTHDKYSWALRDEAALSLVHMRPRNGKRVGLEYLSLGYDTPAGRVQGALSVLSDDARKHIVDDIAPKLVEMMQQPPPPKPADGTLAPDPSVPYKDAAFSLLSHEPPLVTDDKAKADLIAALTTWVQADFEARVDNSSQQFGVEQIMRFLGAPSVKTLPGTITEASTKNDKASQLVADIGDEDTKKRASEALVTLAKLIYSPGWMDKQRALVNEANQKTHATPTAQQINDQLKQYQEQELEKVFTNMRRVGGRPAVEYCLAYAKDKGKTEKMRTDALAAIENRVDKSVPSDFQTIFDIIRDDGNPDPVRGVAMARLGELPKDMIVAKLYTLFYDKKWQVRLDAAKLVLRTISTRDLHEFMRHLPVDSKTKMGMNEPFAYGAIIMAMDPKGGPKPRDVLNQYLGSTDLGAKLTAAASYYQAKKAEAGPVSGLQLDRTPLAKCEPADNCNWECTVAKEPKTPTTVGEFVKWCIEPSLQ